jgi:hypothetical protein
VRAAAAIVRAVRTAWTKLLGWWWRGLARPNPFFDDHTSAPLSAPRVITASERAAL